MSLSHQLRKKAATFGLVVLASAGMVACAEDIGPQAYSPYAAGSIAQVDEGVVIGARPIRFEGANPAGATVGGAVVGGVVGSQFGGGRGDHALLGIAGALAGAAAGHAIAKGGDHPGFAYLIRRARDGSEFEVAQADPYPIPRGTRVYVSYGDRVRVQPIAGYAPPPPPPPPYR